MCIFWPRTADDPLDALHVRVGVEENTVRDLSVSASSPGLLIVTLHWLGQTGMDHIAHVRLVDAHAKGDGGTDDLADKRKMWNRSNACFKFFKKLQVSKTLHYIFIYPIPKPTISHLHIISVPSPGSHPDWSTWSAHILCQHRSSLRDTTKLTALLSADSQPWSHSHYGTDSKQCQSHLQHVDKQVN